ncbi:MAG: hypothetical protein IJ870_01610 [Alphaproteobacteria bacterium]|nr:hypothetical protein [Alphaproteobacteria bacterium]
MKNVFLYLFALALFFGANVAQAERLMPDDQKILCGYDKDNNEVECNLTKQKCIRCTNTKKGVGNIIVMGLTGGAVKTKVQTYQCVSQSQSVPSNCELAMSGGLKGDQWTNHLWGLVSSAHVDQDTCVVYNYFVKYANCYGCVVVQTLTSAFVRAAAKAYDVSKQAGNAILIVGMMIWLALFALKNVSSFATIEPMQMLQQFLVQCFKVILAMVILNSGLETILHYTLVPIITTGTDIADTITANVSGVISSDGLSMSVDDFKTGGQE